MTAVRKTSIRHRLFISQISLILVAVISFFIISFSYFTVKSKADIKRSMKYSADITASDIDNYITSMENCVYYSSYNSKIAQILSDKGTKTVFECYENYLYVDNLFSLTESNYGFPLQLTLYVSNDRLITIDSLNVDSIDKINSNDWYEKLMENPTQFFYFTEKYDDSEFLCIINTLYNPNNYNDIVGYIKVSADLSLFEEELKRSSMANCEGVLLNSIGDVICSSADSKSINLNGASLKSISQSDADTIKLENKSFYGIQKSSGNSHYSVVVLQDTSYLARTANKMFWFLLAILGVVSAASFAISRLISGSIIKSLDTLIYAMKKAKFGELKPISDHNEKNAELAEAISAYNHMVKNIDDLVEYNNNYLEVLKKYEFDFLQMQIKPHFLYNTLDIIQYLAKENKTDDVTFLIKNLSKFYKISLHNKSDFATISDEIKHISYYTAIENFKHDNTITLKTDIPEAISDVCIPKITLQPIIENSINHGILEKEIPEGTISISAEERGGDIFIYITDDGVGMPPEKLEAINSEENQSVGIANTNRRLKLLFGSGYGLTVESRENEYTTVIIKIKGEGLNDKNTDC